MIYGNGTVKDISYFIKGYSGIQKKTYTIEHKALFEMDIFNFELYIQ